MRALAMSLLGLAIVCYAGLFGLAAHYVYGLNHTAGWVTGLFFLGSTALAVAQGLAQNTD